MNNIELVSIVISTLSSDRYDDLIELLEGIKLQTYYNIETIMIIDENVELYNKIGNYCSWNKKIRTIFNPKNMGLAHSRNIGIENSNGHIIVFIDDDAIPSTRWIEAIVKAFDNNDIGAVTGDVIPIWENDNMSWFPKELYWMISCSYIMTPNHSCEIERGFGTNMAFKKELFEKTGVFNTKLGINGGNWIGGEDSDMFLNIKDVGKKVFFIPYAKVFHKVNLNRINLKNIIKRAFNGGISVAVMKRLRDGKKQNYEPTKSEGKYLKKILFDFYPNTFIKLIKNPSKVYLKQMATVFIVIICEFTGYIYGKCIKF